MQTNFGAFLKQKREEKNLTQKELAKLLYVTPSAISKWEKDVARPDISILPQLSKILGVTEHELITASIDKNSRSEKAQAKKWRAISLTWQLFFYIAYGTALLTCFICNLAINKTLSWFWIVLSALTLSFSFTSLPKFITKYKLIFIPLCSYLSLLLLLGVCAIYTNGKWFWIVSTSILLGLIIIFLPIYISKYKIFVKIKKFNDFISIAIDFVVLNILLIIINLYTVKYGFSSSLWYLSLALPITLTIYLMLNSLLFIRFFKINKPLKTSVILLLTHIYFIVPPILAKSPNTNIQKEIDKFNIFNADLSNWASSSLNNNVSLIISLTILITAIIFFIFGLILNHKNKKSL